MNVVLVHGYSVRSLDTYGKLPEMLQELGYHQNSIYLSAFDSLNDSITCDDLAKALEIRVTKLLSQGLDLTQTAFICHSTGAIITRRWLLNRHIEGKPVPRTLITLAGANHGSSLAQMGKTQVAYAFRNIFQQTSVGKEVLEDLDYGSQFLLRLNREWLTAFNSVNPPQTYTFSLIGDDHSEVDHQIFWQTKEYGSDGTVRISGGNLNYRMLSINMTDGHPQLIVDEPKRKVPHLVLPGWSHTGAKGIIDALKSSKDKPFLAVEQALKVVDETAYVNLQNEWSKDTDAWNSANTEHCNATVVFNLKHPGGRNIDDSLILISDNNNDHATVANSLLGHQPIQNDANKSSISFYFNQPRYAYNSPHKLHIEINSGCDEVTYSTLDYAIPPAQASLLKPNEFTYLEMVLARNPEGTFKLLVNDPKRDSKKKWPPLPD